MAVLIGSVSQVLNTLYSYECLLCGLDIGAEDGTNRLHFQLTLGTSSSIRTYEL